MCLEKEREQRVGIHEVCIFVGWVGATNSDEYVAACCARGEYRYSKGVQDGAARQRMGVCRARWWYMVRSRSESSFRCVVHSRTGQSAKRERREESAEQSVAGAKRRRVRHPM